MPPQLRVNMDGHPDENIRFSVNQGLTGMVFLNFSKPQWAQIGARGAGQTPVPKEHRLTAEQIETLDPELRWIIGLPLITRDGGHRRAAAVLNVDGLGFPLEDRDLERLAGSLFQSVSAFAAKLDDLPKVRIMVVNEDENG